MLRRVFATVFANELSGWHTHEEEWPEDRTLTMFRKWFTIEIHSVPEDLCSKPITDDDD